MKSRVDALKKFEQGGPLTLSEAISNFGEEIVKFLEGNGYIERRWDGRLRITMFGRKYAEQEDYE